MRDGLDLSRVNFASLFTISSAHFFNLWLSKVNNLISPTCNYYSEINYQAFGRELSLMDTYHLIVGTIELTPKS